MKKLLLLFILFSLPAWATWGTPLQVLSTTGTCGSGTTVVCATPSFTSVANRSAIYITIAHGNGVYPSAVAGNCVAGWVHDASSRGTDGVNSLDGWHCLVTTGGTQTVTATIATGAGRGSYYVESTPSLTPTADISGFQTNASSASQLGISITPSANDFVVQVISGNVVTAITGGGYSTANSSIGTGLGNSNQQGAWLINSTATAQPTWTQASGPGNVNAVSIQEPLPASSSVRRRKGTVF